MIVLKINVEDEAEFTVKLWKILSCYESSSQVLHTRQITAKKTKKNKTTSHTFFWCGGKTSWALCYVRHSTSVTLSFSHFHLCVSVHVGLTSEVCVCYLEEHSAETQSYNFCIYNTNEVIIQYQKCVFCPEDTKFETSAWLIQPPWLSLVLLSYSVASGKEFKRRNYSDERDQAASSDVLEVLLSETRNKKKLNCWWKRAENKTFIP